MSQVTHGSGRTVLVDTKVMYHLPGLFEFYDLYKIFLELFRKHREYFYDWCEIGSIYGAPADCIWGGGRVGFGDENAEKVAALMAEYGISARLTFAIPCLRKSIYWIGNVTTCVLCLKKTAKSKMG